MEFPPSDLDNSEMKRRQKAGDEVPRQIGMRAIHPTYDDHEDAYSALGGRRPHDDETNYPTGLRETIIFANEKQRESVDPRHVEIVRAYELSLDVLTSSQFRQLSLKDQMRVAVAGHAVIAATERRANVLKIDGNFENPIFQHYGFQSQEEANAYATELELLQHELMTRDVVIDIENTYGALKAKSLPATMEKLKNQTRDLTVSICDDGKVNVGNKALTK